MKSVLINVLISFALLLVFVKIVQRLFPDALEGFQPGMPTTIPEVEKLLGRKLNSMEQTVVNKKQNSQNMLPWEMGTEQRLSQEIVAAFIRQQISTAQSNTQITNMERELGRPLSPAERDAIMTRNRGAPLSPAQMSALDGINKEMERRRSAPTQTAAQAAPPPPAPTASSVTAPQTQQQPVRPPAEVIAPTVTATPTPATTQGVTLQKANEQPKPPRQQKGRLVELENLKHQERELSQRVQALLLQGVNVNNRIKNLEKSQP